MTLPLCYWIRENWPQRRQRSPFPAETDVFMLHYYKPTTHWHPHFATGAHWYTGTLSWSGVLDLYCCKPCAALVFGALAHRPKPHSFAARRGELHDASGRS